MVNSFDPPNRRLSTVNRQPSTLRRLPNSLPLTYAPSVRVGMLLKRQKPEAREIAGELAPWLVQNGHQAFVVGEAVGPAQAVAEEKIASAIDLLVVLGGDGTLLHGASLVAEKKVPLLGINLGHLGFLTSFGADQAQEALSQALAARLTCEERLRLRCLLTRKGGGDKIEKFACNDAVVSQGAARLVELDAHLDGKFITRYRADGLIIATPSGSTAYNLASGGPIVTPDVWAMVVTPISPHTLTNRPLVVPASSRISVELVSEVDHVLFTVDGQWATQLGPGDRLEISQAQTPLLLYRPNETYFDVLRQKLHWGELKR